MRSGSSDSTLAGANQAQDNIFLQAETRNTELEIRLIGLKRSMLHAVGAWIRKVVVAGSGKPFYFLNNSAYFNKRSNVVFNGMLYGNQFIKLDKAQGICQSLASGTAAEYYNGSGDVVFKTRISPPDYDVSLELSGSQHLSRVASMVTQEWEKCLKNISSKNWGGYLIGVEDSLAAWVEDKMTPIVYSRAKPKRIVNVIILRDPFNTFASRLKFRVSKFNDIGHPAMSTNQRVIDNYLELAQIALTQQIEDKELSEKSYYGLFSQKAQLPSHETVVILSNLWLKSLAYRQKISTFLGFPGVLVDTNEVPSYGGGSSFEGVDADAQRRYQSAGHRYHEFLAVPEFRKIFSQEPKLEKISRMLFDVPPKSFRWL
ncbi:MAG: hypothetical protein QGH15_04865 [Kiritimatiellia bacterium]|jgi:hypothetical protein|nr:hypothetical protein [Kiritimatiellia bacterium]